MTKSDSLCFSRSMYKKLVDDEITLSDYNDYCAKRNGYNDRNEFRRERNHKLGRQQSMEENKLCASHLGVHIAENKYAGEILQKVYKYVIHMPNNNIGYDYKCSNDNISWDKIDVKSACLHEFNCVSKYYELYTYDIWEFPIKRNVIADAFLLISFDNRTNINMKYCWFFKSNTYLNGGIVKDKKILKIYNTIKGLMKYKRYEL